MSNFDWKRRGLRTIPFKHCAADYNWWRFWWPSLLCLGNKYGNWVCLNKSVAIHEIWLQLEPITQFQHMRLNPEFLENEENWSVKIVE